MAVIALAAAAVPFLLGIGLIVGGVVMIRQPPQNADGRGPADAVVVNRGSARSVGGYVMITVGAVLVLGVPALLFGPVVLALLGDLVG